MKRSVWGITLPFILMGCFLFYNNLFAATNITVGILPFKAIASQPNPQIENKISSMIAKKLEEEGAKVIFLEEEAKAQNLTFSQIQKLGIQSGTDYILTGSIFIAGQGISIDSDLINIYDDKHSNQFYADAENTEDLYSAISKISKEILGSIYHKKIITDISVAGNKRVEQDAILRLIDTQPGDIIRVDKISKDLRNIYAMGYFDDVIVTKQELDQGIKLVFKVTEKSTVRFVTFRNNVVYEEEELSDVINTRTGSILNIHKINSDVERLRLLYTEKHYHNCVVSYEIKPLDNSQADIIFTINEAEQVKVEKITFAGNQYFSDKDIKKIMSTSEKSFFSFLTGSGILNETEVKNDVVRIESLYKNNGFIDTKISDPMTEIGNEMISIHFEIEEGSQYKIKSVSVKGDLIVPKENILEEILCQENDLYNRENIRKDILSISDIYADKGFANVNVSPLIDKNANDKTMSITYSINKGNPVYFSRVNISGNSKTKDKVIRREIRIIEQDVYSKTRIQHSFKNLNRLDYFEEIDIRPVKTEDKDIMDLDVRVIEKETGSFSVGGGFSSQDGGFVTGSVQERNLFGNGQTITLQAKFAQESVLYDVSFYEPYIFDTKVSGGFRLYKEEKEYDHYDKDATGLSLNLGYRLFDWTTVGLNYLIEDYEITDVDTTLTNMTEGSFLTSYIRPSIKYDSRDDLFMPTEGALHKFSIEYAGEFVGGDIDYTKYLVETGIFFPLFWKFTGALHAEMGYLDDRTNNTIDIDYVRFYLGGMNSVRGFDKYDINGRRASDTKDIGGEKYFQFNAEITVPLTEKYKIAGVLFYDRGDVYRTDEDFDFADQYSSIGTGVRWNSPVGPLRVEYAWVIDGKDVKDSGDSQVEFSVGASF